MTIYKNANYLKDITLITLYLNYDSEFYTDKYMKNSGSLKEIIFLFPNSNLLTVILAACANF